MKKTLITFLCGVLCLTLIGFSSVKAEDEECFHWDYVEQVFTYEGKEYSAEEFWSVVSGLCEYSYHLVNTCTNCNRIFYEGDSTEVHNHTGEAYYIVIGWDGEEQIMYNLNKWSHECGDEYTFVYDCDTCGKSETRIETVEHQLVVKYIYDGVEYFESEMNKMLEELPTGTTYVKREVCDYGDYENTTEFKVEAKECEHAETKVVVENEKAATCTAEGSYDEVVVCELCGEEVSRESIVVDKLNHTLVKVDAVEPTLTETGLTEGEKCSACGTVTVAQEEIPALNNAVVEESEAVEFDEETNTITATVETTEEEPTVTLSNKFTWTDEDGNEVTEVELVPGAVVELTATVNDESVPVVFKGGLSVVEEGTEEEVTEDSETFSVHTNGKLELLEGVYLDGELVDPVNYDLVEGSTIVVFKKSFLATLTTGEHTIELKYPAGNVEVNFNVKSAPVLPEVNPDPTPEEKPEEKVPETGDSVNLTMLYGMMTVSLVGIGAALVARKKYED